MRHSVDIDTAVIAAIRDNDLPRLRDHLEAQTGAARARGPDGVSALQTAIYLGRQELIRLLLSHDALATVHEAAALGDVEALGRFLQAESAALDRPGPDGFPPLHLAAHFAQHEALEVLLDHGAELGLRSTNALGNTALHAAAAGGAVATARILLASGSDPDARDAYGNTPLHVAAAGGAVPVVQALLAGGADPHLSNEANELPVDLARTRDQAEIVAILETAEPH